jgi:hypothetical protein
VPRWEWHREKSGFDRSGARRDQERTGGRGDALGTLRSQCGLAAAGGADPQRADRVEAVGIAAGVTYRAPKRLGFLIFNTPGKLVHHAPHPCCDWGGVGNGFSIGRAHYVCYLCLADPRPQEQGLLTAF